MGDKPIMSQITERSLKCLNANITLMVSFGIVASALKSSPYRIHRICRIHLDDKVSTWHNHQKLKVTLITKPEKQLREKRGYDSHRLAQQA